MSDGQQESKQFNINNLYLEETFTDRKVGTIRRLSPVLANGQPDPDRRTIYTGHTQIMTAMGALPLSFELEGENLEQAAANFHNGATEAYESTMKEIEAMRREQASSLVVPGGSGGGGRIQL